VLKEVVDCLDGLIGWLTLYGHTYVSEGKAELEGSSGWPRAWWRRRAGRSSGGATGT